MNSKNFEPNKTNFGDAAEGHNRSFSHRNAQEFGSLTRGPNGWKRSRKALELETSTEILSPQ
jgi:hypothetical protein